MTVDQIRLIDTTETAVALLNELAESHDWVSVFWDRGWGDSGQTAEISIIVDGNGQKPHARITPAVYKTLVAEKTVGENTLMTFKARRVHDFKTPPMPERTGPDTAALAEEAIRRYMDQHPGQPIVARFSRGLSRGPGGRPQVNEATDATPAVAQFDGWFVLILPGFADAAVSVQEPSFMGPSVYGGGVADRFSFPRTTDGEVDAEVLAGDAFQALLAEQIEAKIAVIEAAQA